MTWTPFELVETDDEYRFICNDVRHFHSVNSHATPVKGPATPSTIRLLRVFTATPSSPPPRHIPTPWPFVPSPTVQGHAGFSEDLQRSPPVPVFEGQRLAWSLALHNVGHLPVTGLSVAVTNHKGGWERGRVWVGQGGAGFIGCTGWGLGQGGAVGADTCPSQGCPSPSPTTRVGRGGVEAMAEGRAGAGRVAWRG